jgi:hypothetical protein
MFVWDNNLGFCLANNYEEGSMDTNVGTVDRMIRIVFGLILLAVPFSNLLGSDWVGQLLAGVAFIVGVTVVISGALARCYIYRALGINTCSV